MAIELQHSETMSGAVSSSEPAGIGGDAALILAALGRIEAVVREERAALGHLRTALADMAQAIARSKAVADSETAAAMLDEFEHRIDAMIEIAGGAPVSGMAEMRDTAPPPRPQSAEPEQVVEQTADATVEPDQVPTVSGVVSQLAPGEDEAAPPVAEAAPPVADNNPTTVAMLTAMVEALRDSISKTPEFVVGAEAAPVEAPPVDAAPEAPAAEFVEWPVAAQETAPAEPPQDVEAEPHAAFIETEAMPAEIASAAEIAETAPISLPDDAALHETALLASFEQMETRPFPPPDEGTAVIFTAKSEPAPEPEFVPAPAASSEPATTAEFVQAAMPQPDIDPVPTAELAAEPLAAEPLAAAAETNFEPPQTVEFLPAEIAPAEPAAELPNSAAASAEAPFDPVPTAELAAEPLAAEPLAAAAETNFEPPQTVEFLPAEIAPAEPAAELPNSAAASAEAEFDPTDFLFGPEPEPDPAAFLLDPAPPPRAQKAVLPQADFVATPYEAPQAEEPQAEPPESLEPRIEEPKADEPKIDEPQMAPAAEADQSTPEPAPHDPLHALKAMSPNEKIAIFS